MTTLYRSFVLVFMSSLLLASAAASAASLPDFREIVKNSSPAVVKIVVEYNAQRAQQSPYGTEEIPEYLRRFFEFRGAPP